MANKKAEGFASEHFDRPQVIARTGTSSPALRIPERRNAKGQECEWSLRIMTGWPGLVCPGRCRFTATSFPMPVAPLDELYIAVFEMTGGQMGAGWNGGDLVEIVDMLLKRHGYDTDVEVTDE